MKEYRLNPEGFEEERKKIWQRLAFMGVAGITAAFINQNQINPDDNLITMVVPAVIVVFVFLIVGKKQIEKARQNWTELRYEVDELGISLSRPNIKDAYVSYDYLKSIKKDRNGNLILKDGNSGLKISKAVEGFPELEAMLLEKMEIETLKVDWSRWGIPAGIVTVVLFVAVNVSENKAIVLTTGSLLIAQLAGSFFYIQNSTEIEPKIKRLSWWVWVVIFSVAGQMMWNTGLLE